MAIPEFILTPLRDINVMQVQYAIQRVLKEFTDRIWNDHELIENIELTAGVGNYIEHRLGRQPRGWVIVRKDTVLDAYEDIANTDTRFLVLVPNVTANCSLVVF